MSGGEPIYETHRLRRQRAYLAADHPDKANEIGQEATPAAFIDVLLRLTAELRWVLAPHGSIAVELGDTSSRVGMFLEVP